MSFSFARAETRGLPALFQFQAGSELSRGVLEFVSKGSKLNSKLWQDMSFTDPVLAQETNFSTSKFVLCVRKPNSDGNSLGFGMRKLNSDGKSLVLGGKQTHPPPALWY